MGRLVVLLVLGGCSSVLGLGNPQPALPPPSCPIGSFDPCAAQTPDGAIDFATDTTLQTDRDCNLDRCRDAGNVIDTQTEEPAWYLQEDLGVRPMAFASNPDGSTKWIFVQMSGLNGFAVVDFATHKEVQRIKNPPLPAGKKEVPEGSDPSHGMAVTSDGKTLVVCSRINNYLYSYSLPDLKLIGSAELTGMGAGWVTLTPDGKTAYVANPVTNDVSVVDVKSMKEIAKIPVGFVPKRNTTALLQ